VAVGIAQDLEATGPGRLDARQAVFHHHTFGRRETHLAGGMQKDAGIRFPAVDLVSAEDALIKILDQAGKGQVEADLLHRAAGSHAIRYG
jgi:hypothetical protein